MGRVLLISCTPIGRFIIDELCNNQELSNVYLCGVVNLSPQAAKGKVNYDNYYDLVADGVKIHYCENVNDSEVLSWMRDCQPDIILQMGWSQKFGRDLLKLPKYCCIGQHTSPLPRGRGAATVNWAIINGETEWGNSFFEMKERYDEGDLFAQELFDITFYDTVATVYDKAAVSSLNILRKNIKDWSIGRFDRVQQNSREATYYKRRAPADGLIHFEKPAKEIYNYVRALTKPYPGAFFIKSGNKITIWTSDLPNIQCSQPAGTAIGISGRGGLIVVAGDGRAIELLRVQPENQPEQWASDWLKSTVNTMCIHEYSGTLDGRQNPRRKDNVAYSDSTCHSLPLPESVENRFSERAYRSNAFDR